MKAENFTELLEIVCITKRASIREIANVLGVHQNTIGVWKKKGVPIPRSARIYNTLSDYLLE